MATLINRRKSWNHVTFTSTRGRKTLVCGKEVLTGFITPGNRWSITLISDVIQWWSQPYLGTDHFIFEGEGGWAKTEKIPAQLLQKNYKSCIAGKSNRNILQWSEIKFIQSFWSRKKFSAEKILPRPPSPPKKIYIYNGPSLVLTLFWSLNKGKMFSSTLLQSSFCHWNYHD